MLIIWVITWVIAYDVIRFMIYPFLQFTLLLFLWRICFFHHNMLIAVLCNQTIVHLLNRHSRLGRVRISKKSASFRRAIRVAQNLDFFNLAKLAKPLPNLLDAEADWQQAKKEATIATALHVGGTHLEFRDRRWWLIWISISLVVSWWNFVEPCLNWMRHAWQMFDSVKLVDAFICRWVQLECEEGTAPTLASQSIVEYLQVKDFAELREDIQYFLLAPDTRYLSDKQFDAVFVEMQFLFHFICQKGKTSSVVWDHRQMSQSHMQSTIHTWLWPDMSLGHRLTSLWLISPILSP